MKYEKKNEEFGFKLKSFLHRPFQRTKSGLSNKRQLTKMKRIIKIN